MKLLVFAHTPPPHHGQSYMVQLMLEGFGGDRRKHHRVTDNAGTAHRIQCYHVNTRLSRRLEDIGEIRGGKLFLLLIYCLKAIWCRFRYGVTNFYYVPAPGKRSALYRDWLVMFLCRPFFKKVILHWHAAGLAKWLETSVAISLRSITYRAAKQVDLSIVLSKYNLSDADKLLPLRVQVVNNGIPDPCPQFESLVLPYRRSRFAARAKLMAGKQLDASDLEQTGSDPHLIKVLYLAHCIKEKGLFDAIRAVVLANRTLAAQHPALSLKLFAAGTFVTPEDRNEFDRAQADPEIAKAVVYCGFVSGEEKDRLFRESDLFCFPTYYLGENQPVNIIEAMAFGLPPVTTRWRSLPEMLPADYPGIVPTRAPEQVATAMLNLAVRETGESLRQMFLRRFTLERHLDTLAQAIQSIETP